MLQTEAINRPSFDEDIYSDAAIREPYYQYRAIRDLGPAVWLSRHDIWAIGRYQDVVTALRDHQHFSSARGISLSPVTNEAALGTLIASDPPQHDALRKIVAAPLSPSAVRGLREQIAAAAEMLVEGLVAQGRFDAVTDLAHHLPLSIVSHLVGLPEQGRENMLTWAAATFDLLGPENDRAKAARPIVQEMRTYVASLARRGSVTPGSWADRLLDHVDSGAITAEMVPMLLRDYLGPSLDTTIFATANLIWLFGRYPDQWEILRANPSLIGNAINEAVRLESPIRGFTRYVTSEVEVDGQRLSAGDRVLLLYASANRDERKWANPEHFDIQRKVADHAGFGFGVHSCAGANLAKLEIECLIRALLTRVEGFELGEPVRAVNNSLRGLASLPVRIRRSR